MRLKQIITIISITVGLLAGCQSNIENSEKNNSWIGDYIGVLPCADCSGIETKISLFENNLFTKTETYIGKENHRFTESGDIMFSEKNNHVTLVSSGGTQSQYQLSENTLIMLNNNGESVTGELANTYTLTKTIPSPQ